MRARSTVPFALLAAALALAACGDGGRREAEGPPAEIEFAQDDPLPPPPTAAPVSAPADAAAGTPTEPVPYDQLQAEAKKGPAQKADAENDNVFY